jgi:hypothetical protein
MAGDTFVMSESLTFKYEAVAESEALHNLPGHCRFTPIANR